MTIIKVVLCISNSNDSINIAEITLPAIIRICVMWLDDVIVIHDITVNDTVMLCCYW